LSEKIAVLAFEHHFVGVFNLVIHLGGAKYVIRRGYRSNRGFSICIYLCVVDVETTAVRQQLINSCAAPNKKLQLLLEFLFALRLVG